jgi:hypothetical protein
MGMRRARSIAEARAGQRSMVARRRKRPGKRLARTGAVVIVDRSLTPASDVPMRDHRPDHRLAAAEREFVLDHILTALWKGKLTRDAAIGRIMAKLSMSHFQARDEVDGFLRD